MGFILFSAAVVFGQDWKDRENWPDYFPRPSKTKKQLFYLQRNMNSNTIAYDLNLSENGMVNSGEPLDVYWKRYTGNRNGLREELSWAQETFAFGYSANSGKNKDEFSIKLIAYKARKVNLKKINGQWTATMQINGKECQLSNIYVYADESGMMPDVQHVDLYGKDLSTGQAVHERFFNN
ncbi:MAG: hypothetical protein ACJAYJ_003001 [Saprospiraceae bacterium]|jgi:hypothetical protein